MGWATWSNAPPTRVQQDRAAGSQQTLPNTRSWTTVLSWCQLVADGDKGHCAGRSWRRGSHSAWLSPRPSSCVSEMPRASCHPAHGMARHMLGDTQLAPCAPADLPAPAPSSPQPASQHPHGSLSFPWHKSLHRGTHPRDPQPGESRTSLSLSPSSQMGFISSHPGCSGWRS